STITPLRPRFRPLSHECCAVIIPASRQPARFPRPLYSAGTVHDSQRRAMGPFSLPVRHILQRTILAALLSTLAQGAWAQPTFVNGLVIPGDSVDATEQPGANAGRLGMFSDLYYDPAREEWWALSNRGCKLSEGQ